MEKLTKARTATFYEKSSHKLVWKNFKKKNQYNLYDLSWVGVRKDNRPLIQNNSFTSQHKPMARKEELSLFYFYFLFYLLNSKRQSLTCMCHITLQGHQTHHDAW